MEKIKAGASACARWAAAFLKGCIDHPHMGRRIPILLASVTAMGLCVMVFNAIGVGTDPFSLFSYGMSERLGISFGTFEAIFNTAVCIAILLIDSRQVGLGSLANMFLVGFSADFFTWLLGGVVPKNPEPLVCALWFVPFTALFLLAVACYVVVELGTAPYDAVPNILAERVRERWPGVPFKAVRIAYDTAFALVGWAVAGRIGPMTVACCVGLGPVIDWMAKRLKKVIG